MRFDSVSMEYSPILYIFNKKYITRNKVDEFFLFFQMCQYTLSLTNLEHGGILFLDWRLDMNMMSIRMCIKYASEAKHFWFKCTFRRVSGGDVVVVGFHCHPQCGNVFLPIPSPSFLFTHTHTLSIALGCAKVSRVHAYRHIPNIFRISIRMLHCRGHGIWVCRCAPHVGDIQQTHTHIHTCAP